MNVFHVLFTRVLMSSRRVSVKPRYFVCAAALVISTAHVVLASDEILTGTTRLNKDTFVVADTITIKRDVLIVTNGYKLVLQGRLKIVVEGNPKIISFEPKARTPGDSGRNAGPIIIQTAALEGTTLRIENVGEDGNRGADGPAGRQGQKGPQGTQRDWNPWNGCIGGSNGGVGGPGGDGGQGETGGNGGSGGTVVFDVKAGFWNGTTARLDMVVVGGAGAAGGNGGSAGPGGPGGDGAPGTFYCGGTQPGPAGPSGRSGVNGAPGSSGNAGLIVDLNGNAMPTNLSQVERKLYLMFPSPKIPSMNPGIPRQQ